MDINGEWLSLEAGEDNCSHKDGEEGFRGEESSCEPRFDPEKEGLYHSHSYRSNYSEQELDEERQHFRTVLAAFRYYKKHSLKKITKQQNHFEVLSKSQQDKLPLFLGQLDALRQCADVNYQFILRILEQNPFEESLLSEDVDSVKINHPIATFHMEKVHTTLRMFMRDWSAAGSVERQQAYGPLIDAVLRYLPTTDKNVGVIRILNPGAGLGRLSWELAKLGYSSIGNEFSLYMLLASNFVLNSCTEVDAFKIYPWIGHASNNVSSADKLTGMLVPDVDPTDLPAGHKFGMVAGDFLEIFDRDGSWDAVVTCFFIDTARNIIEYIEHIWDLLKPGAFWINLGPLLYHFADMPQECCIELSYDELKEAILKTGFVLLEEILNIPCSYVQNPRSMLQYEYRCVFFVCQKPSDLVILQQ